MTRERSLPRHRLLPGLWESLLAVFVVVLSLQVMSNPNEAAGFRAPDLFGYLLTAVGAGAIAWSRRQPLPALAVAGIAATALAWWDYHVDVLQLVVTGLLFMVGSYCPRRPAVLGLVAGVGLLGVSAATQPADLGPAAVAQTLAIFAGSWGIGRLTRVRRENLLALVSVAEQRAQAERELAAAERELASAERNRSMLGQAEERLRIARELHDVLAHSISVISVQATVGEHLAAHDSAAARQALVTIGQVSRSSMQELRQMLSLLRDDSAAGGEADLSYRPAQGLADLEPLVDTFRSAGLPVRTSTSGDPHALTSSADLCAYRIVQEALTNTLKHAGPSSASVGLRYRQDALQVVISDDGAGPGETGQGHGLVGMRERTALLGGSLSVGPGAAGGFTVEATIPYERVSYERVR